MEKLDEKRFFWETNDYVHEMYDELPQEIKKYFIERMDDDIHFMMDENGISFDDAVKQKFDLDVYDFEILFENIRGEYEWNHKDNGGVE